MRAQGCVPIKKSCDSQGRLLDRQLSGFLGFFAYSRVLEALGVVAARRSLLTPLHPMAIGYTCTTTKNTQITAYIFQRIFSDNRTSSQGSHPPCSLPASLPSVLPRPLRRRFACLSTPRQTTMATQSPGRYLFGA